MATSIGSKPLIKPDHITGGCLCGAVRYTITFPQDHDFDKNSGTCQCTQCRRQTGALFSAEHKVPTSSWQYVRAGLPGPWLAPFSNPPVTLRTFCATRGVERGFCGACGGTLFWRRMEGSGDPAENGSLGVMAGSIDPEFLFGDGGKFARALLGFGGTHCWCENQIPGVTEQVGRERGKRYVRGANGETMPHARNIEYW